MKIIHQSYPTIGGPTDGGMIATPWLRVWVHVDERKMAGIAWSEELDNDLAVDYGEPELRPRPKTPLQQTTLYMCPDSDVGLVLLDIVGNTRVTVDQAVQQIEGCYVFHPESLSLRWVQIKSTPGALPNSVSARYQLLAEFAMREQALAEKAFGWVGRPDDALALRVLRAHGDDPDLALRARVFDRRRLSRWARFGMPPGDGSLPGT